MPWGRHMWVARAAGMNKLTCPTTDLSTRLDVSPYYCPFCGVHLEA